VHHEAAAGHRHQTRAERNQTERFYAGRLAAHIAIDADDAAQQHRNHHAQQGFMKDRIGQHASARADSVYGFHGHDG
jgi:hypothetical protein